MAEKSIPSSSEYDERRIALAASFLDGKDYAIHKVTRSGFTTSFVLAAERSGKRVLLVSPTKKIISSTMKRAAEIVGIYGNSACEYNKRAITKYPLLKHLPMSLPPEEKCEKCKYADECCILEIERDPDAPLKSITSAKLIAIMLSDSERAEFLRNVLCDENCILIDEAHSLIASDVPKLPCNRTIIASIGPKLQEFPTLKVALRGWRDLLKEINPREDYNVYDDLGQEVEACGTDRWLIREVKVPTRIDSEYQRKMYGELRKLARHYEDFGVTEQEVILLRDLIDILGNDSIRLSYITTKGIGQIYVCGAIGQKNNAIKNYFKDCARNAAVIFVSGTLYEPHPNFFRDLVGREKMMKVIEPEVEQAVFPDICNTNSMMIIYADTTKLSGQTKHKLSRLPDIIERIKDISESKHNERIHLLAPNIDIRNRLYEALHQDHPDIIIDYYRSADTIGVESSIRVIIAVGLAEVPKNAYDCLSDSYTESQTVRKNDVEAWSWQAWSRGKDPAGIEPSEVYCIGVKQEDAIRVITWGTNRTITEKGKYGYEVTCDEELPKPAVMFPFKQQVHKEQRKSSPFIKKIWEVNTDSDNLPDGLKVYEVEIQLPKNSKSTLVYIRDFGENEHLTSMKVRCFGAIFSPPMNSEQFDITAETLDRFFRSNHSQHAVQQKYANSKGKFPYRPCTTKNWELLVLDMVCGIVSSATYSIGEDGLTVQCAFDIDNHKGNNPALPRVTATVDHLKNLGLQPIVVASGSADSYHIHLPILRTPIATSYNFIKTSHFELKQAYEELDFKNDTEAFPKQKTTRKALGNALKMPLAINNKTGKRSQLLDPDTKEPVDVIFITRVLELREPEKEAVKVGTRQYLPVASPTKKIPASFTSGRISTMRPCILEALNKQLNGGEGHDMRYAIVGEALAAGKNREEIIHLFEAQEDFDETITANYVDYLIRKNSRPWKCETLRDKCSSFIDCTQCPHNHIAGHSAILMEPAMAR
jgi:hypothetical protein